MASLIGLIMIVFGIFLIISDIICTCAKRKSAHKYKELDDKNLKNNDSSGEEET